jgi:hypothetical protein
MRLARPANYTMRGPGFPSLSRRLATRAGGPATNMRPDGHITTRSAVIPVVCGRLWNASTVLIVDNGIAPVHAAPDMLFRTALRQSSRGGQHQKQFDGLRSFQD